MQEIIATNMAREQGVGLVREETDLDRWRRRGGAALLERELMRALVRGTKRGVNGVRKVSQRRVEAVGDGAAWVRAGGVYKRMQQLLREGAASLTAGDWLWEVVREAQQKEQISCDAERGRRGVTGGREEGWRETLRTGRGGRWEAFKRSVMAAVRKGRDPGGMSREEYRQVAQTVKRRAPGVAKGWQPCR